MQSGISASGMATLHPSMASKPCCLNHGPTKVAKLSSSADSKRRNKMSKFSDRVCIGKKHSCLPDVIKVPQQNIHLKVFAARVSVEPTETFTLATEVDKLENESTYLFRMESSGQMKVSVGKKNVKYVVCVEVSSVQLLSSNDQLVMSWGMYRSDSRCYMTLDLQDPSPDGDVFEAFFNQTSTGRYTLELEFEAKQIPFFLSFLLKTASEANSSGMEIRSHRKRKFCVPVGLGRGDPFPLGLSFQRTNDFLNFSILSRNAEGCILCLYDDVSGDLPALELDLDPYVNRSGDIWHVSMENARTFVSYAYRFREEIGSQFGSGHVLLDPYSKVIVNPTTNNLVPMGYRGLLTKESNFDWAGDVHPNLSLEELTVYRVNVKRFTKDRSSQLSTHIAGTFSALAEKLGHFKDLGINVVLLEPIFPYDEQQGPYSPCHFFSPANQFGPSNDPVSTINSMKDMVKRLHSNAIEVFMEVVFSHTADTGALQGIDDMSYYYMNGPAELKQRNTLNCNYPIVQQMILDCLRHWVTEFHIDGFFFMNASSLLRGFHGESLSRPPLIEAIAFDPVLAKTKIIADCWDPLDEAQKNVSFPHWKRWAEVNAKFCTDIRNFLRGEGLLSSLATRLCGSGDVFFYGRGPAFSFNFISRNCGLTLVDLVSFSDGELASELSWNCGEEGLTNKTAVLETRLKQIRNFLFILYISLGVPILNMGDECGQSTGGALGYNKRKLFDWNALKTGFGIQMVQFISFLNSYRRKRADLLQRHNFWEEENINWHGGDQSPPKWGDPSAKFLAMTLRTEKAAKKSSLKNGELFIAFNADENSRCIILPVPSEGMTWHRLIDTALPFPGFFSSDGEPVLEQMARLFAYEMKSHSCTLFETRSCSD